MADINLIEIFLTILTKSKHAVNRINFRTKFTGVSKKELGRIPNEILCTNLNLLVHAGLIGELLDDVGEHIEGASFFMGWILMDRPTPSLKVILHTLCLVHRMWHMMLHDRLMPCGIDSILHRSPLHLLSQLHLGIHPKRVVHMLLLLVPHKS